jgi:hypothetical protein
MNPKTEVVNTTARLGESIAQLLHEVPYATALAALKIARALRTEAQEIIVLEALEEATPFLKACQKSYPG